MRNISPKFNDKNMTESIIKTEKKTALILKGGGVKGLALVGSISVLSEYGYKFDAYVGTSAGAIVAGLLAVGTTPEELGDILQRTTFRSFQDGKWFLRPWTLLFSKYLHPGKAFEDWLEKEIEGNYEKTTGFLGIPPMKNLILHPKTRRLTVFAAQKGVGEVKYDSNGDNKDTLMTDAIRYSMSIPIFFKPKTDGIYDGGILQNFPAERWLQDNPDFDFIGVYLDDGTTNPNSTTRGLRRVYEIIQDGVIKYIFEFFMKGVISNVSGIITNKNYVPFINSKRKEVIVIYPSPIATTDFDLSKKEAEFLVLQGKAATLRHLFNYNLPTGDKLLVETEVTKAEDEAKEAKGKAEDERKKRTTRRFIKRIFKNIILLFLIVAAFWFGIPSLIYKWRNDKQEIERRNKAERIKTLDETYDRAEKNKNLNNEESLDLAIKDYQKLLTAEYKLVSVNDNLGQAFEQLAAFKDCKPNLEYALQSYSRSIEVVESKKAEVDDPESEPKLVLINRGWANQKAGQLKSAFDDFHKACDGNPIDKCSKPKVELIKIENDIKKSGYEVESEFCIGKN